jgi:transcriptional regulator GlxA family with amidase domain
MKKVSILLLEHANLAGMDNARRGFSVTNAFLEEQGKAPLFDIELVGLSQTVKLNGGQYTVQADRTLKEVPHSDIIVIPPLEKEALPDAVAMNAGFRSWIVSQYQEGAQVVSLCLGAFLLGSTGLLQGRKCVTHWRAAKEFRRFFPDVLNRL